MQNLNSKCCSRLTQQAVQRVSRVRVAPTKKLWLVGDPRKAVQRVSRVRVAPAKKLWLVGDPRKAVQSVRRFGRVDAA
jgi:hypothetical protein